MAQPAQCAFWMASARSPSKLISSTISPFQIKRRRVTVGMDGSVYKFHPTFGKKMRRTVARLVCDCIEFEVVLSEDGSGRGAALAAAVGAKQARGQAVDFQKKMFTFSAEIAPPFIVGLFCCSCPWSSTFSQNVLVCTNHAICASGYGNGRRKKSKSRARPYVECSWWKNLLTSA